MRWHIIPPLRPLWKHGPCLCPLFRSSCKYYALLFSKKKPITDACSSRPGGKAKEHFWSTPQSCPMHSTTIECSGDDSSTKTNKQTNPDLVQCSARPWARREKERKSEATRSHLFQGCACTVTHLNMSWSWSIFMRTNKRRCRPSAVSCHPHRWSVLPHGHSSLFSRHFTCIASFLFFSLHLPSFFFVACSWCVPRRIYICSHRPILGEESHRPVYLMMKDHTHSHSLTLAHKLLLGMVVVVVCGSIWNWIPNCLFSACSWNTPAKLGMELHAVAWSWWWWCWWCRFQLPNRAPESQS